ncbi:hypothetical protein ABEF95_012933 [Exophiala dermatitidis]
MADADEDAIPRTLPSGAEDLEDETQDFRFLAQLTSASSSTSGQAIIPKRGTKDFEPNPTRSQASALDAACLAMHTALSAVRVHSGRSHLVGQYLADPKDWRWDDGRHGRCVVVPKFKSTHLKVMGQADRNNWVWLLPEEALFLLERGSLDIRWPDIVEEEVEEADKEVTTTDRESTAAQDPPQASQDDAKAEADTKRESDVVTAPEDVDTEHGDTRKETETNTDESASQQQPAQISSRKISDSDSEPRIGQIPMSLQGAYASFIGKDGLTLERYSVYAGLKRAGYIVQRAPTWHDTDIDEVNGSIDGPQHTQSRSPPTTSSTSQPLSFLASPASLIHRLVSWLFRPRQGASCPSLGPLVAPGLYRNYADIFRALALIPYHDSSSVNTNTTINSTARYTPSNPQSHPQPQPRPRPPFRVHFHVWKPNVSHAYRKTAPPPPDYRIAVIDARTTSLPTLSQIGDLLDSQPEDALSKEKDRAGARLEARIKHGRRNVLLAVVDMGVTSYLRLSDACFGAEKLFEEKTNGSGSKGKGKGKGRGGGAGRGGKRLPGQTRGGG